VILNAFFYQAAVYMDRKCMIEDEEVDQKYHSFRRHDT
jgi:hypothetical protein